MATKKSNIINSSVELYAVTVTKILNEDNKTIGIEYRDIKIPVCINTDSCTKTIKNIIIAIDLLIDDNQSLIINRADLVTFITLANDRFETDVTKEMFNKTRKQLREFFDVLKISFNPRTLIAHDKTFILHKRQGWY
jgi:hypothetical protein